MASIQAEILKSFLIVDQWLTGSGDELDIDKERKKLEKTAKMFKCIHSVQNNPVTIDGTPAEWIIPNQTESNRTLLYLHGGSYNAGSINTHRVLVSNIASIANTRALIIDYRLAPEFPFPASIQDANKVYKWLLDNGNSPKEIIIAGDSAGGGLTLALLLVLKNEGKNTPAAAVCLSPWIDLEGKGESISKNKKRDILLNEKNLRKSADVYRGATDIKNPLISPIYGDLKGLPPLLIQVGSDELLLSDSVDFAAKAKTEGVDVTLEVWKDMQHVWQFAGGMVPESRKALNAIGKFINEKVDS